MLVVDFPNQQAMVWLPFDTPPCDELVTCRFQWLELCVGFRLGLPFYMSTVSNKPPVLVEAFPIVYNAQKCIFLPCKDSECFSKFSQFLQVCALQSSCLLVQF